jgi:hypothetical protein
MIFQTVGIRKYSFHHGRNDFSQALADYVLPSSNAPAKEMRMLHFLLNRTEFAALCDFNSYMYST